MEEQQQREQKRIDATASVTGGTEDAKLARQDQLNKSRADMLASVASRSSELKDKYANDWSNRLNGYYGQLIGQSNKIAGVYQNNSNQWGNMASDAYSTAFKIGGSTDFSAFDKK